MLSASTSSHVGSINAPPPIDPSTHSILSASTLHLHQSIQVVRINPPPSVDRCIHVVSITTILPLSTRPCCRHQPPPSSLLPPSMLATSTLLHLPIHPSILSASTLLPLSTHSCSHHLVAAIMLSPSCCRHQPPPSAHLSTHPYCQHQPFPSSPHPPHPCWRHASRISHAARRRPSENFENDEERGTQRTSSRRARSLATGPRRGRQARARAEPSCATRSPRRTPVRPDPSKCSAFSWQRAARCTSPGGTAARVLTLAAGWSCARQTTLAPSPLSPFISTVPMLPVARSLSQGTVGALVAS
jgi:hypothetical protein